MSQFLKASSSKIGKSPGTIIYTGKARSEPVRIEVISYNKEGITTESNVSVASLRKLAHSSKGIVWINVIGLHQPEIIEELGTIFGINALVLEDIANVNHRPKFEYHGSFLFITLKMLRMHENLISEHFSIITKKNTILTFQEQEGDLFDSIRTRLKNQRGRIRGKGSDYLTHALVDAIIDNYFPILEKIGDRLVDLEEGIQDSDTTELITKIHQNRRMIITLRRHLAFT